MNVKELVNQLNKMILEGKSMEAFEKFYAENVVMQENDEPPTEGKDANRAREEDFFRNLENFAAGDVKEVVVEGDTSMVRWYMDFTHKQWGRFAGHQIALQKWKDGKIVSENFYYSTSKDKAN
ncbi:MAG: SnoaL-like domain-containing protein [Candidatus Caenarcaniphilales bacterium]|nr:SnoaL-like domain-containing protein [Candidatus Caenarcaniphilales bacterium]